MIPFQSDDGAGPRNAVVASTRAPVESWRVRGRLAITPCCMAVAGASMAGRGRLARSDGDWGALGSSGNRSEKSQIMSIGLDTGGGLAAPRAGGSLRGAACPVLSASWSVTVGRLPHRFLTRGWDGG